MGFTIKDTFDAVLNINSIHKKLFDDKFRFVSFGVKSLFTNIPLTKTNNIILQRIHHSKLISTNLSRRSLDNFDTKLLQMCTKTIFSNNGNFYEQIDGVSKGSFYDIRMRHTRTTFVSFIMTKLENIIIKPLINDCTVVFYDDMLTTIWP